MVEEDAPVQVFPEIEICMSFTSEMEMLLQKNSMVYITKPDELDNTWMRDSAGLWRNGHITWVPADV